MKVYKFGGGVLQSSESIRKLTGLIQAASPEPLVVVVSALGKTTQVLEEILQCRIEDRPYAPQLQKLYAFHQAIIEQLLGDSREAAYQMLASWKEELLEGLEGAPVAAFDKVYGRVVAGGEWLASKIVAYYLQERQVACAWLDARDYVRTEGGGWRAEVDWVETRRLVRRDFLPLLRGGQVVLTQGFIGSNGGGETTTLGKEGSDFTGAILAAVLEAESLTIWKDVPGVMNADPKLFGEATKFDVLSYQAMARLAFYGAKVVHPKTIQPLATHSIPLYVRPFYQPDESGTLVTHGSAQLERPAYVLHEDQVFVQLSLSDLTFFDEECMQEATHQLEKQHLGVNMLERGACELALCLDNDPYKVRLFLAGVASHFKVMCRSQVSLLTIMNPDKQLARLWLEQKEILLAQQKSDIYQAVFQP